MAAKGEKQAKRIAKPLEKYGLIGNMISAALVGSGTAPWIGGACRGSNSPACLAALLGSRENGRWLIAPRGRVRRSSQRYVGYTAVLETRFETADGVLTVTDFMPLSHDAERVDVVRLVRCEHGAVDVHMELALRFGYGLTVPWVRRRDYGLSAVAGPDAVELHTPAALEGRGMATVRGVLVARRPGDAVHPLLSSVLSRSRISFPDRSESLDAYRRLVERMGRTLHLSRRRKSAGMMRSSGR